MDAAIPLIANKGISGFSIEELCQAASMKRTSYYTYFKSIDQLVMDLWAREAEYFHERFRSGHAELKHGIERLHINLLGFFEMARENPVWNKFSMQLFTNHETIRTAWMADIARDVEAGRKSKELNISPQEEETFTQLVVGVQFSTALNLNFGKKSKSSGKNLIDMLMRAARFEN